MTSEAFLFIILWIAVWGIGFWFKTVAYMLKVNLVQMLFEDSIKRSNTKKD